MPATEKMHSGSGSGDPEKTGRPTKFYDGRRMLESGHRFMPNVSTRKLTKAIEGERKPNGKVQAAGVPLQKEWLQHQEDLQGTGHSVLHHARLAGQDEQARIEGPVQQETHGQAEQACPVPSSKQSESGCSRSRTSTDSSQVPGSST